MKQRFAKKMTLVLALVLICAAMLAGCGQPSGEGVISTPENSSTVSGEGPDSTTGSQSTPEPEEETPTLMPDAEIEEDATAPEQGTPTPPSTTPDTTEETPAPATPAPKPITPAPAAPDTSTPAPTPAPTPSPTITPIPSPTPTPMPTPTPDNSQDTSSGSPSLSGTTLQVRFGDDGAPFAMNLYANATADKIAEYVGTADWRLPIYNYEGYDNWEVMQFYDIPSRYDIPSNPQRVTSEAAGAVYYSHPNRIVLFFGDAEVSSEYTPIGYITYSQDFEDAVKNNPVLEGWGNKIVNISDD